MADDAAMTLSARHAGVPRWEFHPASGCIKAKHSNRYMGVPSVPGHDQNTEQLYVGFDTVSFVEGVTGSIFEFSYPGNYLGVASADPAGHWAVCIAEIGRRNTVPVLMYRSAGSENAECVDVTIRAIGI